MKTWLQRVIDRVQGEVMAIRMVSTLLGNPMFSVAKQRHVLGNLSSL